MHGYVKLRRTPLQASSNRIHDSTPVYAQALRWETKLVSMWGLNQIKIQSATVASMIRSLITDFCQFFVGTVVRSIDLRCDACLLMICKF
jgi:hypothetical protein